MTTTRTLLFTAAAAALASALACDGPCDPGPEGPENQDPPSLGGCPELPPGTEPIPDLAVARAHERFGGLMITLSDRPLACGESAAQHDYCGDGHGVTLGVPADLANVGAYPLKSPVFVEFETPDALVVGGGGEITQASVELFTLSDLCVTGRIVGLTAAGGPFEGGFRAPRCTP